MTYLADTDPGQYSSHRIGLPYGDGTRQACDVCIGRPAAWDWAIEVKMLRLMGDNGKLNDNMIVHILSPYPAHRSALTDCAKLLASKLDGKKAILIFGYDYPGWPMGLAIDAFGILASRQTRFADCAEASFDELVTQCIGAVCIRMAGRAAVIKRYHRAATVLTSVVS